MSKFIKQMEMDNLRETFQGVRDLVVLSMKGLSCHAEHTLRSTLRKKQIRIKQVKNSLTRRVFGDLGLNVPADSPYWAEPTVLVWGAGSAAELAQAVEGELLKQPKTAPLYKDKVKIKGGIADGQPLPFDKMTKLPTRAEAIGRVLMLIRSPAGRVAGQIVGPAKKLASQINTIKDKEEAAAPPAEAAAAPPA